MTDRKVKSAYWIVAVPFILATIRTGIALLLGVAAKIDGIVHLGYPVYICTILGAAKLLGGAFGNVALSIAVLGFVLASYAA